MRSLGAGLAVVVLAYLVVLWIDRSRVGHVAAAARENELRVRALGLQPYTAKLVVFVVGIKIGNQDRSPEDGDQDRDKG